MEEEAPVSLVCKHCGNVFGMVFTPITPEIVAACAACVAEVMNEVMQGKPAQTAEEWREVEKRL